MRKRKGMGKGMGMGYKNLVPRDSYVHAMSARGVKSNMRDVFERAKDRDTELGISLSDRTYISAFDVSDVGDDYVVGADVDGEEVLFPFYAVQSVTTTNEKDSLMAKGTKLNMMGLETIKRLEREATERARMYDVKPYRVQSVDDINDMPPFPFPFIGEHVPKGYKKVNEFFVDSSGFGTSGEPALTVKEFKDKMKVGKFYAITQAGQFQVYVAEYEKV